jgi:hypothetical protein
MIMTSIRVVSLLLVAMMAMPMPAGAASRDVSGLADLLKRTAQFCDGTYALCIKVPCTPIASRGKGGTSIDSALCSCDVVKGWSMGPASCAARAPAQDGSYTTLMSTYSNGSTPPTRLSPAPAPTRYGPCATARLA